MDWTYSERLARARESKGRRLETYAPGTWSTTGATRPKARTKEAPSLVRPVYWLETRTGEDGEFRPGSVIWVIQEDRLLKRPLLKERQFSRSSPSKVLLCPGRFPACQVTLQSSTSRISLVRYLKQKNGGKPWTRNWLGLRSDSRANTGAEFQRSGAHENGARRPATIL